MVGVITSCPEAGAWAAGNGVARATPAEDPETLLGGAAFDYLLSVVNHRVTPEALVRRAARAAVNYHNSLLPALGGFNAPAWAILGGHATHGVTWHRMAPEVDAGGVFLQAAVPVADDDTAFTLEAKCAEAAVATFGELTRLVASGDLVERPQAGPRTFHTGSDRPGAGALLLDWGAGASAADRLVRALAFGPQDNPLGVAKVWDGAGPLWVGEAQVGAPTDAAPGAVLDVEDGAVVVAAGGRQLRLTGLRDPLGAPVAAEALAARGVRRGAVLPAPDPGLVADLDALDAAVRRSERFWVRRLAERTAPALEMLSSLLGPGAPADAAPPDAAPPDAAPRDAARHAHPVGLSAAAAAALDARDEHERTAFWAAALGLFVARLGGGEAFDLDVDLGAVPDGLAPFFATRVPVRVAVPPGASAGTLVDAARDALALAARHRTYARDAVARYAALRRRDGAGGPAPLPVALARRGAGAFGGAPLGDAALLRLDVAGDGRGAALAAADPGAAAGLAARLAALAEALLTEPGLAADDAPVLAPGERRLLDEWNATAAPFRADACVHELFEEQAARTPDKVAVVFGDDELTYAALDRRADAVAERLRALGAGPGTLVGLCIERSLDMVAGLLGVLKAGAAYVPLDPAYPRERLSLMLADAQAPVLLTRRGLAGRVDAGPAAVLAVEDVAEAPERAPGGAPRPAPDDLAYVIFTSGSTGRPKGVMVTHRNVTNFFAGMDRVVGAEPGVWLALTSISFDISVLELFWTLARGFEVVVHPEQDRASVAARAAARGAAGGGAGPARRVGFGLFYFAADAANARDAYRLLVEGAKFADANGFDAVWTPERHFHAFGGLYPNPAVTAAALATVTSRVQLRAGSVVLPLHDPVRVAEEWAVVDNLSHGRVGLSFASGWHADDFALRPDNYARRRELLWESIDEVRRLWRGEAVQRPNGEGRPVDVRTLPRPVQPEPPVWVASAGNADTFRAAGARGVNVLTNMLGQTLDELRGKLAAYREARAAAGHEGPGVATVMLHTFVGPSTDEVRRLVREPFTRYLATSLDLVKVAPWAFPAFRAPAPGAAGAAAPGLADLTPEELRAVLDHAFDRYFETAGLFGTPEQALATVDALRAAGVDEVACLVDFGVDADAVLAHLPYLAAVMEASRRAEADAAAADAADAADRSVAAQLARRRVTHLQCTPSLARLLAADPATLAGLGGLDRLLLGGEALPPDLAAELAAAVRGRVLNMYGPTETTVWSTAAEVRPGGPVTVGRPIANTVVRLLDERRRLVPVGAAGELYIGGAGVTRGYLGRPDLTAERFVDDPYAPGARLYRTGDLARYAPDGALLFLGRVDQQVKISGHRIELGEVESVLAEHPGVAQAVVAAESHPTAGAQLVAYVVPRAGGDAPAAARVDQWRSLWDAAYAGGAPALGDAAGAGPADPRLDTAGWTRSDTGEPVAAAAMREWRDQTVARLRALRPRRVLEIGCGTGMLLYGLLPEVEHYTAVDVAPQALARIGAELRPEERAKVTLVEAAADEAAAGAGAGAPELAPDLVVINSVAQYFPDGAYLRRVLERAVACVRDGGHVFVGDVRSAALLGAFHAWAELARAPGDAPAAEVGARAARRAAHEGELAVDPAFFHDLAAALPRLTGVRARLKRGRDWNEMTRFRYDVVLSVGGAPAGGAAAGDVAADVGAAHAAPADADGFRALLAAAPPLVRVADVPNARVGAEVAAARLLAAAGAGAATAAEVRARAAAGAAGFDPEALAALDDAYEVEACVARSGAPDRFDVVFRHRAYGPAALPPDARPAAGGPATNRPAAATPPAPGAAAGAAAWRGHLRARLPEYMVPSRFVELPALPLTPNGKVDRRALAAAAARVAPKAAAPAAPMAAPNRAAPAAAPAPGGPAARGGAPGAAADGGPEAAILDVWRALLGVDEVPADRNLFDLGANSLLAVQASRLIAERLGRDVPLVALFQFPTVRRLAAHLAARGADLPAAGVGAAAGAALGGRDRAERRLDAAERRRAARAPRVPE